MLFTGNLIGWLHLASALAALLLGGGVFLLPKGGRRHRGLGYGYVAAMLLLNGTALLIYRLTGHAGPFHVAALFSLATVVAGFLPAYRRRPRGQWLHWHYAFMCWSYVGLVAAGASEVATRLPEAPFWGGVVAASLVIFVVGGILIEWGRPRVVVPRLAGQAGARPEE